jgi:hypothetical protein
MWPGLVLKIQMSHVQSTHSVWVLQIFSISHSAFSYYKTTTSKTNVIIVKTVFVFAVASYMFRVRRSPSGEGGIKHNRNAVFSLQEISLLQNFVRISILHN